MARMRLTVDTSALDRDLQRALRRNPRHAQAAVRSRQLNVFRQSQQEVPVDTSVLEQSGQTPPPFLRGGRVIGIIQYTAAYAWSVHENPRSGQTGGVSPSGQRYRTWARRGKWKYLEHPMRREAAVYDRKIAEFLRRRLWR